MMKFMKWCVALAAAMLAACVFAQTYPGKPVRWVVPFPPGGGTDLVSRTIAQKLSEAWGIQVVADNRPGSGGTIGLAIARAKPDAITYGSSGNGSLGHLAAEMIKNPQGNRKVVEGNQGRGGQG
jgi:tripartite-type tricarboxylate transporter receptor subunit TctC